ncbi:MAG TPA: hypothetical protein VKM55_13230 [Candidatus Lokiarchaeia archaeon]|nr:hypothetical protein [Candidatus Lokiarchaeia archaeon]
MSKERRKTKLIASTRDKPELLTKIQGIREPLSVINIAVCFLKTSIEKLKEKEARHLEIIEEQIKRVNEMIDGIMSDLPIDRSLSP